MTCLSQNSNKRCTKCGHYLYDAEGCYGYCLHHHKDLNKIPNVDVCQYYYNDCLKCNHCLVVIAQKHAAGLCIKLNIEVDTDDFTRICTNYEEI